MVQLLFVTYGIWIKLVLNSIQSLHILQGLLATAFKVYLFIKCASVTTNCSSNYLNHAFVSLVFYSYLKTNMFIEVEISLMTYGDTSFDFFLHTR